MRRRPVRVLFLCTGNSARSQIAEALLNLRGRDRFIAESAGSAPAARVNPNAIEALAAHGIFWEGRAPRGLDAVANQAWDVVITVCDRAQEACPLFPGQPVTAHWGMPDPAGVRGDPDIVRRAFDDTLMLLRRRVDLLVALPVEKLARLAMERELRAIPTDAA